MPFAAAALIAAFSAIEGDSASTSSVASLPLESKSLTRNFGITVSSLFWNGGVRPIVNFATGAHKFAIDVQDGA